MADPTTTHPNGIMVWDDAAGTWVAARQTAEGPTGGGMPITGEGLEAGGVGAIGWLSSLRKAIATLFGHAALTATAAPATDAAGLVIRAVGTTTTREQSVLAEAGDASAPVANTAAVVTLAAPGAGVAHAIGIVHWSYSDTPTAAGRLTITDGAVTIVQHITTPGAGYTTWPRPRQFAANAQVVITLSAGGTGVSGAIEVEHWTEA